MVYRLGPVKDHVKRAADVLGPKYGFTTVYGWGSGSVPNSDHPKGLALDFMTRNKTQGDALVSDLITNASTYGVKYIIWWGRIWQDGNWKEYTGFNPHRDHVHVSFNASGATNINVGFPTPDIPGVAEIKEIYAVFTRLNDIFKFITDPNNWARIGVFTAGVILILIAFVGLGRAASVANNTVKGAVKNAK